MVQGPDPFVEIYSTNFSSSHPHFDVPATFMAEEASILYLSLEMHLLIFSHLDALDLLRISMTCFTMHTLIDQKGVWKQSLKNTCSRNALFEPSFPLDLMTIDDLKHAALGPALWHHTVLWAPSRGSSEIPSMPHTERCISSQYENSWTPTGVFLIPGGRFLLCTSRAAISLKDLGVAGPSFEVHKEPVVLGVVYMKYDWQVIGISTPIRHGRDSIRFVVGIGIPGSDIRVYEIGPIPKDCALRQVGRDLKIAYTPAMRRTWIGSQDRVYIHFKNDAAVWDYSLHRIWFWSIAKEGVREITHVGKGDLLVGLTPTGAVLWEVPWLSRIDDLGSKFILDITANSDASAPTILEPCYEVEYPRALQPGNFVSTFSLGLSSGWYESEYKSDASATANPNPGCHHHAAILPPALFPSMVSAVEIICANNQKNDSSKTSQSHFENASNFGITKGDFSAIRGHRYGALHITGKTVVIHQGGGKSRRKSTSRMLANIDAGMHDSDSDSGVSTASSAATVTLSYAARRRELESASSTLNSRKRRLMRDEEVVRAKQQEVEFHTQDLQAREVQLAVRWQAAHNRDGLLDRKAQELRVREEELRRKEEELGKWELNARRREEELQQREESVVLAHLEISASKTTLDSRELALDQREKDLERRKRSLEAQGEDLERREEIVRKTQEELKQTEKDILALEARVKAQVVVMREKCAELRLVRERFSAHRDGWMAAAEARAVEIEKLEKDIAEMFGEI
ncbi:hypothetical protein D9611_010647 [Ephemerocybe angulata]|uniref:F-box domain-containing protein n=1 Tax=Ephemerocybe angulata TaxID=980116 RepID=A0A8H5BVL7_9AGAR|nr:hypothetical protein D9611_010647 [Tulosesus angulatus]